jgi:ribosomal protein L7Ae-like RNA K-turn-binding protein
LTGLRSGELPGFRLVPGKESHGLPERQAAARVLELIGLSARAGAVVFGTSAVRAAAREGSVYRVILAEDAAAGQRHKLVPLLDARKIPYSIRFSQEELGAASGRAPVSAVGFSNSKLAARIGEILPRAAFGGTPGR